MAIDTAAKRLSALGQRWGRLPFGRRFASPLPDGEMDAGDRQQLAFAYRGIESAAPSHSRITHPRPFTLRDPGRLFAAVDPGVRFTLVDPGRLFANDGLDPE